MKLHRCTAAIALLSAASAAGAQQGPPVRQLGPALARTTESFTIVSGVRHLPGGKVLVNDIMQRRLLMFDSTLASFTVVADSTSGTANAYGARPGGLIAYRGDSTLFIDPASMSMLVIDPSGQIARVMSVPRSQDAGMLASPALGGSSGFDAAGRLVYRGAFRFVMPPRGPNGAFVPPEPPDSGAIVRVDLTTRQVDTVGMIKIPRPNFQMSQDANGRMTVTTTVNPLPQVDEWAVLSDGSVALIRGRDYHIDWVNTDGTGSASPKIPFEWERLSDEAKVAFIDSVKAARERMRAEGGGGQMVSTTRIVEGGPAAVGGPARQGGGGAAPGRGERERAVAEGAVAVFGGGGGNVQIMSGGPGGAGMNPPNVTFIAPADLPDYKPPFLAGSVRADADGNLWIRTTKFVSGAPVYDVVNRKGELIDRVRIPANRSIAGFGAGGVMYLAVRENNATTLERVMVR